MNRLITFEGIEGCGKTTQIRKAEAYLANQGIDAVTTHEPGGTPLGKKIRDILLNRGPFAISAQAELLLFAAARAQHVRDIISPALQKGTWVLCDRFFDATLCYQGFGRGLDVHMIKELHRFTAADLQPGLTLLFDLPVETGLKRAMERISRREDVTPEDRFEREDLAFHQRIRDSYLTLAAEEPGRFRIIDASRDIAAVHGDVCRHLTAFRTA